MEKNKLTFRKKDPVQIRFNDVDIVGHVNNVVFQHYYDYGRLCYFDEVFADAVDWNDVSLVLVKITTEYFHPVYLEDKIFVKTKIIRIGNKSIEMVQQVVSDKDNTEIIHSECTSILSGYERKTGSSTLIPNLWRKNINDFEKDLS